MPYEIDGDNVDRYPLIVFDELNAGLDKIHLQSQQVSCSFCPLKSTCNIKTAGVAKSYMLTEKGKKLLGKGMG